jgi:hypothetical protein
LSERGWHDYLYVEPLMQETKMSTFDEREKAYEGKFAHDEEQEFKAFARRNKLLGLWAAELLRKRADQIEDYALDVVKIDLLTSSHEEVFELVNKDLGSLADEETIRTKMAEFLTEAKGQITTETHEG